MRRCRKRRGNGFLFFLRKPFTGSVILTSFKEITVVKIAHPELLTELFLVLVYFPPTSSAKCEGLVFIDELAKNVTCLTEEKRIFIVLGDHNARTGDLTWSCLGNEDLSGPLETVDVFNPD